MDDGSTTAVSTNLHSVGAQLQHRDHMICLPVTYSYVCGALHTICCRRNTPIDEEEMLRKELAELDDGIESVADETRALLRDGVDVFI